MFLLRRLVTANACTSFFFFFWIRDWRLLHRFRKHNLIFLVRCGRGNWHLCQVFQNFNDRNVTETLCDWKRRLTRLNTNSNKTRFLCGVKGSMAIIRTASNTTEHRVLALISDDNSIYHTPQSDSSKEVPFKYPVTFITTMATKSSASSFTLQLKSIECELRRELHKTWITLINTTPLIIRQFNSSNYLH